ncbi:MAG: hypothetical protein ACREFQ_02995, partial [Stellaceae bacterium]
MKAEAQSPRHPSIPCDARGHPPTAQTRSGRKGQSLLFAGDWRAVLLGGLRAGDVVLIAAT